jgi:hypothetical protein
MRIASWQRRTRPWRRAWGSKASVLRGRPQTRRRLPSQLDELELRVQQWEAAQRISLSAERLEEELSLDPLIAGGFEDALEDFLRDPLGNPLTGDGRFAEWMEAVAAAIEERDS